ncbi:TraR/DksA family transcriptional regulator [Thalassiella azotivora]
MTGAPRDPADLAELGGPADADPLAALAAEHAATTARLADLERERSRVVEGTRDANTDDEHDPEGATIAFEREQLSSLVEQARTHLLELEAARERVRLGSYGTCADCGQPVPAARLAARPTATRCVACAARATRRR